MTTIPPFPSATSAWRGGRPAPAADPDGFEALLAALLPAAQAPAEPAAEAGARRGVTPAWPGDLAGVSRVAEALASEGEVAAEPLSSDEQSDASGHGTGETAGATSGVAAGVAGSPGPGGEDRQAVTGSAALPAPDRQASGTATGAPPAITGPAPSPADGGVSSSATPDAAMPEAAMPDAVTPDAVTPDAATPDAGAAPVAAGAAPVAASGLGTDDRSGAAARGAAGPGPASRAAATATTAPVAAADTPAAAEGEPVAPPAPATATGSPGPAAATRSALAQRVAEIVERLEHAPPPRRITVEMGELRLTVSLRGDGVQVTSTGAPPPAGWREELAGSLAQRGFTLAGEGGERDGRDPQGRRGDADERPGRAAPGTAHATDRPLAGTASGTPAGLRL